METPNGLQHSGRSELKHKAIAVLIFLLACTFGLHAGDKVPDKDLIPPQLPKDQRENLQSFLQKHEKPDRYLPRDAKLADAPPGSVDSKIESTPEKPIKQYMVQIVSHRPVPGQEEVKRVDVLYYRPNPEKGKPGITVKRTVDLTTGKEVGQTEVFVKRHTPLSREELEQAVELARSKSTAVAGLYKDRDKSTVQWEYLQLLINRKNETLEPGDRAVRLVFTATVAEDQTPPEPVRVIVNLTKDLVTPDPR